MCGNEIVVWFLVSLFSLCVCSQLLCSLVLLFLHLSSYLMLFIYPHRSLSFSLSLISLISLSLSSFLVFLYSCLFMHGAASLHFLLHLLRRLLLFLCVQHTHILLLFLFRFVFFFFCFFCFFFFLRMLLVNVLSLFFLVLMVLFLFFSVFLSWMMGFLVSSNSGGTVVFFPSYSLMHVLLQRYWISGSNTNHLRSFGFFFFLWFYFFFFFVLFSFFLIPTHPTDGKQPIYFLFFSLSLLACVWNPLLLLVRIWLIFLCFSFLIPTEEENVRQVCEKFYRANRKKQRERGKKKNGVLLAVCRGKISEVCCVVLCCI